MTSTSLLVLLGGGLGTGLVLLVAGSLRHRLRLEEIVAAFEPDATNALAQESTTSGRSRLASLGESLSRAATRLGHPVARPEDLAILGRDREEQLSFMALGGLGGAGAGAAISLVLAGLSKSHGSIFLVLLPLAGGLVGILLPARRLSQRAQAERERFLRGFGCWLELVALAQAGGMGIEGALRASYSVSSDRSFRRLGEAFEQARFGAMTPWEALRRLGEELSLPAVLELAATLALAGMEGARVRTSLLAKSESLRQRAISDAEAKANSTTERLFLPSIVLMLAFLVFLMYPAGVRLAGLL